MIAVLQAALLGIVQGLTEFIPVSSSGHLALVPELFGWREFAWGEGGLAFEVFVHMGTLLAVLAYFRREWLEVARGFFSSLSTRPSSWSGGQKLAWLLVLATVPAAAAGAALSGFVETSLGNPASVAFFLMGGALVMSAAELMGRGSRAFPRVQPKDAGSMGLAQVLALAPGMSRSGVTIAAGVLSGLDRDAAARFSFMMLAPVTLGAGALEAVKLGRGGLGEVTAGVMLAGFATSAVTGFLAIRYLLRYLRRGSLWPFAYYCASLSCLAFALWRSGR